jgi:hypothetical protein
MSSEQQWKVCLRGIELSAFVQEVHSVPSDSSTAFCIHCSIKFKYPEIQHLFSAYPQYDYTLRILSISQWCSQGCHSSGNRQCQRVIKSFCFKGSLYLQNVRVSVPYDIVIFHKYGILWSPCIAHYFDYTL